MGYVNHSPGRVAFADGGPAKGQTSTGERAVAEVRRILNTHQPEPMDEALAREIGRIVEAARRELA